MTNEEIFTKRLLRNMWDDLTLLQALPAGKRFHKEAEEARQALDNLDYVIRRDYENMERTP